MPSSQAERIELLESKLAEAASPSSDMYNATEFTGRSSPTLPWSENRGDTASLVSLGDSQSTYLGPSSGRIIANSLGRIVQDASLTSSIPVEAAHPLKKPSSGADEVRATLPDDELGSRILDAYFQNTHVRLPFLDRSKIFERHATRNLHRTTSSESEYDCFRLFMVYAIGAANLQMTGSYTGTQPTAFFETALRFDSSVRKSLTLAGAEAMALLVLYNLRSSNTSKVWYMMGLAMRICIDYGLHREAHYRQQRPFEAQIHRRLFWSIYILERYSSWSLGRPFSIAEEEIDADLPADLDDSITDDNVIELLLLNSTDSSHQAPGPNLRRFISCVRLQRIMSRIHLRVYRVDMAPSTLVPEISPLLASLEEYKETLPVMAAHEAEFVDMHWNNSVRMLLQPFLNILPTHDNLIARCLHASGQMCQLFKKLRQRDPSGYSFLLVNGIFMAGLTMCFCLFRSPTLLTGSVSNNLRAASSALFVMAERDSSLKKYRDALEALITRVMDFVNGSDSTSFLDNQDGSSMGNPQSGFGYASHRSPGHFPLKYQNNISSSTHRSQGLGYGLTENIGYPLHDILTEEFWTGDPFIALNMADGLNFNF
ncbi:fungal specific transcription factor domain-containing protein [Aspergillus affinis]|uniref:fungal specific transcription factor domain-containing protein n=1 Tax=Aspergillus affinis TaxID=1070780 RepID=UPI0022FE127B|nr:uncharacterized protein KD926_009845 [Aspergillus affinis]KAI9039211.1 hypothetical protein KD926_009845 [Aspergillus affinis]